MTPKNATETGTSAKVLLALTALFWSSGGILIKWVNCGPLAVAGFRSLIAGVVLYILFRPGFFPLKKSHFWGALTYALTVISFVAATKWTTAANAILLQSTAPIYIALFGGIFLGEKMKAIDWATIVIAFLGMVFFFKGEISFEGMQGNLLGLFSGLTFAWFILVTRKFSHESPITMIVLGNFLASALCLPLVLAGPNLFGSLPSLRDWLGLILLGVFQLALPYSLYSRAIGHVPAIDAVLIVLIEPILNPIWVFLFLGERPSFWSLVGGAVVLGAVTARSLFLSRARLLKIKN